MSGNICLAHVLVFDFELPGAADSATPSAAVCTCHVECKLAFSM